MTSTATEVTQTQSLAAVRNFIRVAVSCVTYLRGLCSDESYQPRQFLGLQLKQLVRSSGDAGAISRWMEEGAFDALNRGYLKELSLCVHEPNCTELLERYSFMVSYSPGGQRAALSLTGESMKENLSCSFGTVGGGGGGDKMGKVLRKRRCRQEVQQALASIITKLMEVVEGLPPLLCERVLTMQLKYYEDVTPPSYEPPCFAPASPSTVAAHYREEKNSTDIATLDTGHHTLSINIRHKFFEQLRPHNLSQMNMYDASSSSARRDPTKGGKDDAAAYGCRNERGTTENRTSRGITNDWAHADEVAFLVFTSFILTKSPTVSRGRITMGEIEEYLRVACPMEIEMKQVQSMMRRLETSGIVSLEAPLEWAVSEQRSAAVVSAILERQDVVSLLSVQTRMDLRYLTTGRKVSRLSSSKGRKRVRA
ncbi:putative HORMA domain protein [Trypanosoma equiperdum]|uniref:HORMA domain-containing protein n=2 Tax=Trypanozoon TaxID=39700 RepID=Q38B55_TRYB2|nr:hypothetical protein, conserved [Trypanosoma brucei brucei TREU927]EAN77965.1 hypothetical protein, conserved [Trypanosoma brucei brucei TREU927]SCU71605.1 predicted HORMA domain protein [Trypanosoma equiperdum]